MDKNKFQSQIYDFYDKHARVLPWRSHPDPYRVFVSEIMLQQTQVSRVIEKFKEFMLAFPNFESLADAQIPVLLKVWSGLGYNRRALMLKKAAQVIVQKYGGILPDTLAELEELPGIGPATAASISAFAFNNPVIFIETNVRSVFIHHFFSDKEGITDSQLLPLIEQTLDRQNPRKWYSALMDYGSMLKKLHGNPSRKSKHHTKQSKFEGSDRQIRGAILKALLQDSSLSLQELISRIPYESVRIQEQLTQLQKENFIEFLQSTISLKS